MKILNLLKKHKQIILYLIFGALTTLVNIGAYWLFAYPVSLGTVPATVLAWLASVIFAFITNKLFVFESKGKANLLFELGSFFASRLFTGVLDTLIMLLFADVLAFNDVLIKIISNVLVIILNYVLSRLIVFRRRDKK